MEKGALKKIFRRAGLGFLIVAVIVALLVLATAFYAESDGGKDAILDRVNAVIPGNLSVESVDIRLWKGIVDIRNLKLKDSGDTPIAGVKRISVDVSWTALVGGDAAFAGVEIHSPWLDLRKDVRGETNIRNALVPASAKEKQSGTGNGLPLNLVFQSVTITDGRFSYLQEKDGLAATMEGIGATGNGNLLLQKARATVSISGIRLQKPGKNLDLGSFNAQIALNRSRIETLAGSLSGPSLTATVSASADNIFKVPNWKLTMDGRSSLAAISTFFSLPGDMTGDAEFTASIRGQLFNPDGRLEFTYTDGTLRGTEVESASGHIDLNDRTITISDLRIQAASGSTRIKGEITAAPAFENGMFRPPTNLNALGYHVTVNQQHLDLKAILPEARGTVDAAVEISGKGLLPDTLSAKTVASARATKLTVNPNVAPVDVSLNLTAGMDGGIVGIENLAASAGDLTLALQGKFDFSRWEIDGTIDLDASNLTASLAPLGIRDVRGGVSLNASVSGPITRPVFRMEGTGENLHFRNISFGDVAIHAAMESNGVLKVTDLSVDNQGSVVRGTGRIRIFGEEDAEILSPNVDFKATLKDIEIQDFYPWGGVVGTFGAELQMSGALKTMKGSAKLHGSRVKILEKYHLGEAQADLDWNAGRLMVKKLTSDNGRSSLTVSGALQLLAPGTFSGLRDPLMEDARLSGTIGLEDLLEEFSGAVEIDAALDGRLLRPSGMVALSSERVGTPVQQFSNVRVTSRLSETAVSIDRLTAATAPDETLSASGALHYDGSFSFDLDAKGISTTGLQAFEGQDIFSGRLYANASGSGDLSNPTMTADIRLEQVSVNDKPLDSFTVSLDVRDRKAKLDGRLNFDIRGRYDLQRKNFFLTADFDQTEISPYMKLLDRPDLSGVLTGSVTAEGYLDNLNATTAKANLSDVSLNIGDVHLVSEGVLRGAYADGRATLEDLRLSILKQGWVRASGGGDIHRDLALQATGEVPLAIVGQYVDIIKTPEGTILFSGSMNGPVTQPEIEADVELKNLGFAVGQWPQKFHKIRGRITATPKKIVISEISGNMDSGRFTIQGEAALSDLTPEQVDLRLQANGLPIEVPDTMNATLNTDLAFSGTPEASRLDGDIVIAGGKYFKDVRMQLLGSGKKERPSTTSPSVSIDAPFLRQVALNVAIKRLTPFRVDNNIAELEITPDLNVGGTLSRPTVSGRTSIDSGEIKYQKKTFTVTKGSIDFLNPYGIDPTIRLESETRIRDWDIFLTLSGTPDQMQLQLTSDPQESENDIVSLLLFGKTSKELISSEGGFTGSTEQMLASMIESRWGENIRSATGLDIFSVGASDSDQGTSGNNGVKVTLGKELTQRLTLKYEAASGNGEMNQRAIAEYRLLENLLVSGFQGDDGQFGGELQFRMEFR